MSKPKKAVPVVPEPSPPIVTSALYGDYELSRIRISPDNRKRFNEAALNELAESIKSIGIAQPILMRPVTPTEVAPEQFEIVAGERRFRASKIAGRDTIPAVVRELSDLDAAKLRILENLQREDPHPIEEAEGYQLLMLQHGYNADQLADEVKKSRAYIYGRLKLCDLTTAVRDMVLSDVIPTSTALLIARIPVPALQIKALHEIIRPAGPSSEQLSVRRAADLIQARYMLDLTTAIFKPSDAKLLASAGSCTACPKRAGNQPVIFEGISADVCTDPECYGEKKAAHHAITIVLANKKGIPVAEGDDRNVIYNRRWDSNSDLLPLDEHITRFSRNAPATKNSGTAESLLVADKLPPVATYTKDEDGSVRAWFKRSDLQAALEAAGACESVEQHAARMAATAPVVEDKPEHKTAQDIAWENTCIEARQENEFRVALYKKLRASGAAKGFSLESLREFTKLAVRNHPLPDDLLGDVYSFDTSSDDAVCAYVDGAGLPAIQLLLIDLLVGESLDVDAYTVKRQAHLEDDFTTVRAMARHEGIEPEDVREELFPTRINVDDATVDSLTELFAKYPMRLDELNDIVLRHQRGELTGMLGKAAEKAGYHYTVNGWEKLPPLLVGAGINANLTEITASSVILNEVRQAGGETSGDDFLQEMMVEAPKPAKSKAKAKVAAAPAKLSPAAAWPFPKTSKEGKAPKEAPTGDVSTDKEQVPA